MTHETSPPDPRSPLNLAVHTLPDLTDPRFVNPPPSGHGKLLAIVLACSMPLLLAYAIFFLVKPSGQASFGELIHPARPMPAVELMDPAGHPVALNSLKNQWLLVSVASGPCDESCVKHLFIQRQLREMLNKDKDRIDRIWLTLGDAAATEAPAPLLQDTQVLRATPELLALWFDTEPQQAATQLFVVDPHGNAMLRLPADQDGTQAHKALRVLQKLMAASAVWDHPGR